MQKLVLVLFALIYLFTATEFRQLLKVPILIEHYVEHSFENEHINVFEFVSIHYLEGLIYDNDVERDMELPFKNPDQHVSISIISTEIAFYYTFEHHLIQTKSPIQLKNDSKPTIHVNSSVWHPPKA